MILVLDASVVAKWFKEEESSYIALKIRSDFQRGINEIVVPDLLLYELSNAMRFDPNFNSELIKKSIHSLFEIDITIVIPSENLISDAIRIAIERDITVYDAIYVALSSQLNAVFITADERLFKKIKSLKNCRFLSENYE